MAVALVKATGQPPEEWQRDEPTTDQGGGVVGVLIFAGFFRAHTPHHVIRGLE